MSTTAHQTTEAIRTDADTDGSGRGGVAPVAPCEAPEHRGSRCATSSLDDVGVCLKPLDLAGGVER